jgi:hypothetical protein
LLESFSSAPYDWFLAERRKLAVVAPPVHVVQRVVPRAEHAGGAAEAVDAVDEAAPHAREEEHCLEDDQVARQRKDKKRIGRRLRESVERRKGERGKRVDGQFCRSKGRLVYHDES